MFHEEHFSCEYRKYVVSLHLRIVVNLFIVERRWRVVESATAFFKGQICIKLRGTRNE